MTVLILGPNGSGKSVYAEKLASQFSSGALYYIATMIPYGEEGKIRVEKHRKQREGAGFITIEKPSFVSEIPLTSDTVVLLEDVSNLLGNALFDGDRNGSDISVFTDIESLCLKCRNAVIVSIDDLIAKEEYDNETLGYIDAMNRLNRRLFDLADVVVSMRDGMPDFIKGEAYALD